MQNLVILEKIPIVYCKMSFSKVIYETYLIFLNHSLFYIAKNYKIIRNKSLYVANIIKLNSKNIPIKVKNCIKLGDGFFYDAAVYQISVENYLFNNTSINKKDQQFSDAKKKRKK